MRPVVPRVAALHDLSGFGRTSLTVVIPILSAMGAQVCPLPTALLSTHTVEFTGYTLLDLTEEMGRALDHWERLDLRFDVVYSGFMACPAQMDHVARCIERCLAHDGLAVVDPVLVDNGALDPTMTPDMVERMRWLVSKAHVITPNFTEAAFLLGEPCRERIAPEELGRWLRRLRAMGPDRVVITSVPMSGDPHCLSVAAIEHDLKSRSERLWKVDCAYIPAHYPGTGDAFASVLIGGLLAGDSLPIAMDRAVQFVSMGIRATFGHNFPTREGIVLERILDNLRAPLVESRYAPLEVSA
jgi:pyridoxine kinase